MFSRASRNGPLLVVCHRFAPVARMLAHADDNLPEFQAYLRPLLCDRPAAEGLIDYKPQSESQCVIVGRSAGSSSSPTAAARCEPPGLPVQPRKAASRSSSKCYVVGFGGSG